MGYSKNLEILESVRSILDVMMHHDKDITWKFDDATNVAWSIRNALFIAKTSKDPEIHKYSILKRKFTLNVEDAHTLKAKLKEKKPSLTTLEENVKSAALVFDDVTDLFGIMDTLLNNPLSDKFMFLSILSHLNINEKESIITYCSANKLVYSVDNNDLTISRS